MMLNALDGRLVEITGRIEELRLAHKECPSEAGRTQRQPSTPSRINDSKEESESTEETTLSELWAEMARLEEVLAACSPESLAPLRKSRSKTPAQRLFSLFLHYTKWSCCFLKCIRSLRLTLAQL